MTDSDSSEGPSTTPPSRARRSAMRQQRVRDTVPEVELRRALRVRGLGYRLHRRLLPDSRRTTDIVFIGARVAIDVRGCFWHGCPEHARPGVKDARWWTTKIATNVARDADTVARLESTGWVVVVVWEHEDPGAAAERVAATVRARR